MTRKFSELREKMTPEARAESARLFKEALAAMPLYELQLPPERQTEALQRPSETPQPLDVGCTQPVYHTL
jgi:hypothetical protein